MGFILSKFRRSKPSTKDILEAIDKELRSIQRFQVDTELQQKKIIGRLIICSSVLYLVTVVLVYFLAPRGMPWKDQLKFIVPLILFPFLIWGAKRFVAWYYEQKIVRKKDRYAELKKEKQRILEDVIDNESFKVGKEILEKYAPSQLIPKHLTEQFSALQSMTTSMSPLPMTPQQQRQQQQQQLAIGATPSRSGFDAGLRRRPVPGRQSMPMSMSTPLRPQRQPGLGPSHQGQFGPRQYLRQSTNTLSRPILALTQGAHTPFSPQSVRFQSSGPSTPQPMYALPQPPSHPVVHNRSPGWMDKLVEYVIGDGPNSRYALICRYCATHNGLATEEEFPYLGYRCVFCKQYNPPKQVRPSAPKLPTNTVLIEELESTIKSEKSESPVVTHETDSETEKTSESTTTKASDNNPDAQESTPAEAEVSSSEAGAAGDNAQEISEPAELVATESNSILEDKEPAGNSEAHDDSVESMEVDESSQKIEAKETTEGFQILDAHEVEDDPNVSASVPVVEQSND